MALSRNERLNVLVTSARAGVPNNAIGDGSQDRNRCEMPQTTGLRQALRMRATFA